MATHGGTRSGSGRKKGAESEATKKRKKVAEKILESADLTPLQVMMEAMKEAYKTDGAIAAVPFAKEAAPYLHPKLSSVDAQLGGRITIEAALAELQKHPND